MKIFTIADVPDELAQQWLQHLRDFDTAHPGCHFDVAADAPDMTMAQMLQAVRVDPDLTFKDLLLRPEKSEPAFTHCSYCASPDFITGPRGGVSLNITCAGCGARFNVIDHPAAPRILLEELQGPTASHLPPER